MSNVRKFLDLSTGHLHQHVMNGPLNSFDGVIAYEDEDGAWLWVPTDELEQHVVDYPEVPPEVVVIWRHAIELDCDYVRFDRDGPKDSALPTWDW